MTIVAALQQFLASASGLAIQGVALLAFLDFATGVLAAIRDKSFQWGVVDSWVRRQLAGRVIPIFLFLFVAYFAPPLEIPGVGTLPSLLSIPALAAAGAYVVATASSLIDNFLSVTRQRQYKYTDPEEGDIDGLRENPVPQD